MSQPISSFMQRQVCSVGTEDTIATVEALFVSRALTWAPVRESNGTLVGAISASDLLQFHAQGLDPTAVQAWQRCSYKPITVGPDMPISDVARLMIESKVHHVVVTSSQGIVGVVSSLDFVRTFARD